MRSLAILLAVVFWAISAAAIEVQVAEAPTDDLTLTVSAIQSAKKSLLLNIYELTSPQIADALISRIRAGVHVEIIEEGQPVGGLSAAARGIQSQLIQAMQDQGHDHLYEMTSKAGGKRRFRYDHAKYAVIDGQSLLIGSENYSPTGNPEPGSVGNRGWEVLIHDVSISTRFAGTFAADSDQGSRDIIDLASGNNQGIWQLSHRRRARQPKGKNSDYSEQQGELPTLGAAAVEMITSPNSSLSGLVEALNGAETSIDIEQMTFDSAWKGAASSPLLDAVEAAAKRGVRVRVLLNDESVFDHPGHPAKPKNTVTADILNQLSQDGLDVEARIADIHAMGVDYIHNKGLLIDRKKTLISSINWDENSVEKNREAAVLITSEEIFSHYSALFEKDWDASKPLGVQSRIPASSGRANVFSIGTDSTSAVDCPSRLHVLIQVGQLRIDDSADQDFASLSNQTLAEDFVKSRSGRGCILVGATGGESAAKVRYLQIRRISDGEQFITIEGYTPKTQKLYSIRSKIAADEPVIGEHSAAVYNGSGPSREKLGEAEISLEARD